MKRAALAALLLAAGIASAAAAELQKSYSYFSIRGNTLEDIERELARRGPNVATTGERHPGATRMEFKTQLNYADHGTYCALRSVNVRVSAKVILPRWRPGRKASADTRFIWDTLAADIKRHEEAHVVIAHRFGGELERSLRSLGRQKSCDAISARAAKVTEKVLGRHDREQQRFDRIESAGFEKRLLRLMETRMRQEQSG